jgi:long-chain acyl-CoA synthetase
VKLSHGEYIALEKLEAQYKSVQVVANMIVHADPSQAYIVAVVVPGEHELRHIAAALSLPTSLNLHQLCTSTEIVTDVLAELNESAKRAGFKGVELLKAVRLVSDEWTAETGMLTAAQKIKRKDVVKKYKTEIDAMYGKK